ncbi:MAG: elongation factor P maturation arginine rhamnosyltransferase EarP [Fusobacteriaceae bacterium]|nr:elongation factor P maturation arginine rhamnosyltransferase EarP [Fusobacteriaceae bacterium]
MELPLSTQSPGFDIFCKVIDNYGDIGVVLRLAKELRRTLPGETSIRVIVNSLKELKVLCPAIKERRPMQQWGGLTFIREDFFLANFRNPGPAPLILQTFGCELPEEYLEVAREKSKLLVNIEYLTGEKWAEGCHLKESPGPGTLRKYFYFPGFTPESGGILSRPHLSERIRKNPEKYRFKYFGSFGAGEDALRGTVFSYERDFSNFFEALRLLDRPVLLLVIGEKAGNSVRKNLSFFHKKDFGNIYKCGKIELKCVDFFNQDMYEELVDAADFNLARGEDSAAIAAASGKPYLWELYPQEGNAQMEKLEGFLRVYGKFWDRESPQWEKTAALFREYNDRSQGTQDPSVESWLHYFRNLDAIASVHEQFAAELTTRCNLLEKLKSFIQEYSGGKL